jgi:aspartate 1-decarboxylase
MRIEMLKSKIHRARVTDSDLNYEGSISICPRLLDASRIVPWERVDVYNINNGQRFSTYAIPGETGQICLNGAAARLVQKDDLVIIASYCSVDEVEIRSHAPAVVMVDLENRPIERVENRFKSC